MKQLPALALLLLASTVGLGLTGFKISHGGSLTPSILPASLFYTGAVIAFGGAVACIVTWIHRGN